MKAVGAWLSVAAAMFVAAAACAPVEAGPGPPRLFGLYRGQAVVTTSPYYPPGSYEAEATVAETPSGLVGYVNIVFDASDTLGGTITHAFSSPAAGGSNHPTLKYSDRLCGAGDPIGKCYPHSPTNTQYSFEGTGAFVDGQLLLSTPAILPGLPYGPELPFDSASMTRVQNEPRSGFDGVYENLEYIWMGTVILPTPLPLFGNNYVEIQNGEIVTWIGDDGNALPFGILVAWCFDDARRLGWMNQQGTWWYHWVLHPDDEGVAVIVTFDSDMPDCEDLQDPLAGRLDEVHADLVGIMFELSAPAGGPGRTGNLQVSRSGRMLDLTWDGDCGTGNKYGVYRGDLAAGYDSMSGEDCSVTGTSASLPEGPGAADFFLVVPNRQFRDGSYGLDSRNIRRPAPTLACHPPGTIDSCAP